MDLKGALEMVAAQTPKRAQKGAQKAKGSDAGREVIERQEASAGTEETGTTGRDERSLFDRFADWWDESGDADE